jgi:hypothetical protein
MPEFKLVRVWSPEDGRIESAKTCQDKLASKAGAIFRPRNKHQIAGRLKSFDPGFWT